MSIVCRQQFLVHTYVVILSVLLTGIVGCSRVLNCGYIIQEADVEVRPELLPSGLLDYRVQMRQLQRYFSEDAWQLLTSAGNYLNAGTSVLPPHKPVLICFAHGSPRVKLSHVKLSVFQFQSKRKMNCGCAMLAKSETAERSR